MYACLWESLAILLTSSGPFLIQMQIDFITWNGEHIIFSPFIWSLYVRLTSNVIYVERNHVLTQTIYKLLYHIALCYMLTNGGKKDLK